MAHKYKHNNWLNEWNIVFMGVIITIQFHIWPIPCHSIEHHQSRSYVSENGPVTKDTDWWRNPQG